MSKQRRGACVFCGRDHDLTKQHILPDRLKKILPRITTTHKQTLVISEHSAAASTSRPIMREHQGHLGNRKLRKVCGSCNRGWIREGEEAAFDLISTWILGNPRDLDQDQQIKVAIIASTIFAMVDLDDFPTSVARQQDRTFMFDNRCAPPSWHIFIGRIEAPDWAFRFRHHGSKILIGDQGHVHISTVGLGNLLLHLVDTEGPWADSPEAYAREFGLASLNSGRVIKAADLARLKGFEVDRLADSIHKDFQAGFGQFLSIVRSQTPNQR